MDLMYIVYLVLALSLGIFLGWLIFRHILNGKYLYKIKKAELEAEAIRKNKMQEIKDKFFAMKADLERQITQRSNKVQSSKTK